MVGSNISLNRLFFLREKKIDSRCPYFVIEFVSKSLGIKFDFGSEKWKEDPDVIINYINEILQEETLISMDKIENHLPDIALFINPETSVQWKSSKNLIDAFWSICNFTPKIPLKSNESFGFKTESNPSNIDPIMVYQIAYHYKIPISRETTIENIQKEICNYSVKLTPLRQTILSRLKDVLTSRNRKGLIDIKSFITDSPTGDGSKFPDKYPRTNEEAIQRAAKEYRWDISMSSDPIKEYIQLDSVPDDKYSPVDIKWGKIFDVNRKFFHLDFRYMEKYDSLYSDSVKKSLIYRNGNSTKSSHLVLGLHPENKSTQDISSCRTIINFDKIPSDHVERYRQLISTPDFICTREELFSLWNNRKCTISPYDSSKEFSDQHQDMIRINSDPNDKLRRLIENIRNNNSYIINKSVDLCKVTKGSIDYFIDLMDIGMTIRGYKTCYDDYPLLESRYDSDKYQREIENKVILKTLSLIEKTSNFFDDIPVFTGRNIIGEESSEYTIKLYGDNLNMGKIIRRILDPSKIEGCIRTNSNYILVTSWYYLTKLEGNPPFNISDLRFIS